MTTNISSDETTVNKKNRKPRSFKINPLEEKGFDSSCCWSHPKLKKFLNDQDRNITSYQPIRFRFGPNDHLSEIKIGNIICFEKGPNQEELLILEDISLELFDKEKFTNYINNNIILLYNII